MNMLPVGETAAAAEDMSSQPVSFNMGGLAMPPLQLSTSPLGEVTPPQPLYDDMAPQADTSPSETSPSTFGGTAPSLPPLSAVPTACLGCREKHLKCDGQNPCSRCRQTNIKCVYIASRRGYKGPRRAAKRARADSDSPPPPSTNGGSVPPDSCPMMLGMPRVVIPSTQASMPACSAPYPPVVVSNGTPSGISSMSPIYTTATPTGSILGTPSATTALAGPGLALATVSSSGMATSAPVTANTLAQMNLYRTPFANYQNLTSPANLALAVAPPAVPTLEDRCLDAFYHFFFPGHPFVLPRPVLLSVAKETTTDITHLMAAMRYVGSLYIDAGPTRSRLLDEAIRLAYRPNCPKDGFLVQTLMMLIIGLDGNCEQEQARQHLAKCETISVEIGLNQRTFATIHGRGDPVFEESWRRTWWDLFVIDGMVAGVHRMTNFLLFDIPANVALPCEEHQYLAREIPTPAYLEDFDDQLFSGEDREFSSFAYRIAAARILGRFMRCPPILNPHDENLEKIESMLSNWRMHLPPNKRDDLTKDCQLDEMMFQAHFMNHACSILLHQPHSQLDSSPARSVTSCAPHRHVPSGDLYNTHTKHTITAACEISKMVTQAVPLLSHTHFFTCVITLSSIVHLSKWAQFFLPDEDDLREQIRLNIGALSKLSEVWRAANTAGGQVKGVAQEIYRAKKAQQSHPAFWVSYTQEEMISSINADESIMQEFDSMLPVTTTQ